MKREITWYGGIVVVGLGMHICIQGDGVAFLAGWAVTLVGALLLDTQRRAP